MNRNASKCEWAGKGSFFPSLSGILGTERKFCGNGKDLGASGRRI